MTRQLSRIERRIFAAIRDATAEGLTPKSLYLTPDDRAQLEEAIGRPAESCADLPVRPISGRGRSALYCRHGIARALKNKQGHHRL